MTLWTIDRPEYPREVFRAFAPEEVLIEYDQPLTFTFRDRYGRLLLAHLVDEDGEHARYVVAAATDRIIVQLKAGAISIVEALDQPATWILDVQHDSGETAGAWAVALADLPGDVLPEPDVLLYPDLERTLPFDAEGVIDEADKRHRTFVLRGVPGIGEQTCRYDPQIHDDVIQAFVSGKRVRVKGVRPRTSPLVSATEILPAVSPAVVQI